MGKNIFSRIGKKWGRTSHLLILMSFSSLVCFSQDDHYWSQQFGAPATLMGGAVIGGVRDNSAIFYNPGALAFINYPSLSITANVYKMDKIFIDDGAGDGINLNSAQTSIYPQIISGLVDFLKVPRFHIGYCLMTRNYDNIMMNSRITSKDVEVDTSQYDEYIGVFDLTNQMNEQWFGIGIGYELSPKLGIGITFFGTYRTHTNKLGQFIREIYEEDSTYWFGTLNTSQHIKYRTISGLAKLGLNYAAGRWKIGLTLTTGAFRVYGKGDIQREFSVYTASEDPQDTALSFIIMDNKNDVRASYHHPWSVGFGIEYQTPATRLAVSGEYFFRQKPYSLMAPSSDPFVYPPYLKDSAALKEMIQSFLHVENASRAVFNIGIGLEQHLYKDFWLLAGAYTDFSSFVKPSQGDVYLHSTGSWDLYHCSAGLSYRKKKQILTAGISYSFSPSVSIDPLAEMNPMMTSGSRANVFAQTFAFIIGYTYLFPRE